MRVECQAKIHTVSGLNQTRSIFGILVKELVNESNYSWRHHLSSSHQIQKDASDSVDVVRYRRVGLERATADFWRGEVRVLAEISVLAYIFSGHGAEIDKYGLLFFVCRILLDLSQHDVVWLDVPMSHSHIMEFAHAGEYL